MRHRKSGRKLNRTSSHRKALMRSLASELFEHKRIHTTLAKAKELRPYAEQIITRAKRALDRENQGKLPEGSNIDVHARRMVYKDIRRKHILEELFDTIAPAVMERNGGYTRIVKTGVRRGDAGQTALIELVDWNTEQDPGFQKKRFVKKSGSATQVASPAKEEEESAVAVDEAVVSDTEVSEAADVAENVDTQEAVEVTESNENQDVAEVTEDSTKDTIGEETTDVVDAEVQPEAATEDSEENSTEESEDASGSDETKAEDSDEKAKQS
ncbi:MAG: hypothetical protein Kapaf2KO_11980 [Candidatus Kapaibacteriales bacterium]